MVELIMKVGFMSRILIFTGKGGVGKTSIASAHAVLSAKQGIKTLIVSTDMAHNLCDVFDRPLGKTITTVFDNLDALEIDPNYMMENEFQDMKASVSDMLESAGVPIDIQTSLLPGMDELFSLLKIMALHESKEYERIIVDCAPTGETLTLLKFPELLSWYMEKFFPVGKVAMRVLSPISKAVFKMQLPDKAAMNDIEKLFMQLVRLQTLLKDHQTTSIRLVAMPEKMIVEETKRNYMYMNLYDFNVDGVYINRILPSDMENPFFDRWLDIQSGYIEELSAIFADIPLYKVPWFDSELQGVEGLDKIAESALEKWDVFKIHEFCRGVRYDSIDNGYLLTLFLPHIASDALDVHESGTDIIIKIGNFKRNIPKPNALRHYQIIQAKFENQQLLITLSK